MYCVLLTWVTIIWSYNKSALTLRTSTIKNFLANWNEVKAYTYIYLSCRRLYTASVIFETICLFFFFFQCHTVSHSDTTWDSLQRSGITRIALLMAKRGRCLCFLPRLVASPSSSCRHRRVIVVGVCTLKEPRWLLTRSPRITQLNNRMRSFPGIGTGEPSGRSPPRFICYRGATGMWHNRISKCVSHIAAVFTPGELVTLRFRRTDKNNSFRWRLNGEPVRIIRLFCTSWWWKKKKKKERKKYRRFD